jgi:hypothetical protein
MTLSEIRAMLMAAGVTNLETLEGLTPDVLVELMAAAYTKGYDDGEYATM